ncbi:MAG: radical SAM protein [archaeon]
MALFEFQDLSFSEEDGSKDKREKGDVRVTFLKIYHFFFSKEDLSKIANFRISEHSIEFDCDDKQASKKFNNLMTNGFNGLVCSLTGLKTVYLHQNSGIPIIGEGVFGLIDRNTNCIEVKPLTCCNLDCVFCSVDAGPSSSKVTDYIIEKDYLIQEFNRIAGIKVHDLEAHIGPQGEPLLYAPLVELIRDLKANPKVKVVSIDTNGTLLTKKLIDDMAEAGLTRLNISLQAMDEGKCTELAGRPYNLRHVLEMIDYAADKVNVLLAPVIIPGLNDDQLEKLVAHGKLIKSDYPQLGLQNFLNYKRGRNPVKQREWDEFFSMLESIENKEKIKLRLTKEDFGIEPDTKLDKPLQKRDVVKVQVMCDGPEKGEKIAAAMGRAIIVEDAANAAINSTIRVQIIRDKHNIYRGIML